MNGPPPRPRERRRLVAFVDASAFYCSCERLFRAELRSKPVVVLSNNDGCVIARTEEAKALGVPMGAPYFKIRDQLARDGVTVFSSNYALYHDLSARVEQVLGRFSPDVEKYSIDEAFLELDADPWDVDGERERLEATARDIRRAVWAATRIPVRVSIAETKTLAKAGAEHARTLTSPTVCFWKHPDRLGILARLPVGEVWGVGPRWAKRLRGDGAMTAAGLAALPDDHLRRHYNVVLLRTAMELRGVSCLPIERCPPPRKSLIRSRMFGTPLTDPDLIGRAVGLHASNAAAMLREQKLAARVVEVFVTTGRHGRVHHGRAMVELPTPTNDTFALVRAARSLVSSCVRHAPDGDPYRYKKAGVMLTALGPEGQGQADLFRPSVRERPALMEALDSLTRRFGAGTVAIAAQGTPDELRAVLAGVPGAAWGMKREHLSPRATTWWDEIVRAVDVGETSQVGSAPGPPPNWRVECTTDRISTSISSPEPLTM